MNKVIVIAEAGVNHNGDFETAKILIEAAAAAGADYVKFQTFNADKLVSREAKKAIYQKKNVNDGDDSQYAMLKRLEIPEDWYNRLLNYASLNEIKFLSSGFDQESVEFLDRLGVDMHKIPSVEITNRPYLQYIAKMGDCLRYLGAVGVNRTLILLGDDFRVLTVLVVV